MPLARIFRELLREMTKMVRANLANRRVLVPRRTSERYVAGTDTRGRQEGRPYPWSQQVIHEISGLAEVTSYRHQPPQTLLQTTSSPLSAPPAASPGCS